MKTLYWYELKLRPPGPGCQPRGFVDIDYSKGRWGIVAYAEPLKNEDLADYEMRPWSE